MLIKYGIVEQQLDVVRDADVPKWFKRLKTDEAESDTVQPAGQPQGAAEDTDDADEAEKR